MVLIGVNRNPHHPLHGCVLDTELTKKYLIEDWSVSSNHIQHLLSLIERETTNGSTSLSCTNILKTLYSLIDNANVLSKDNIIIYFVGNSVHYDAREYCYSLVPLKVSLTSWRPLNILCSLNRTAQDDNRTEILDISIQEIKFIFTYISHQKGYKIMLIFGEHSCMWESEIQSEFHNLSPLLYYVIVPMFEGVY